MSTNHDEYAMQTPKPYQGEVIKPETPQADGEKCSVAEAANFYDLPPIIARFGDWVICEDGINCLYDQYHIPKSRFNETDWFEHMTEKTWVNPKDFASALEKARKMVASGQI